MSAALENDHPRYAVYFVPAADSALYRFGSAVLGYDSFTGRVVPSPPEFERDRTIWRRLTRHPRLYGFHATLKAPFRLSGNSTESQLVSAVRSFALLGRSAVAFSPAVETLSGFAAVVAAKPNPVIDALAADCTTIFDAFRAPMTAKERARRVAAGLNSGQIENLDRWGYPYLFGDFRFHMTLTAGLADDERQIEILATLRDLFDRMCGSGPVAIDRITLPSASTRFPVVYLPDTLRSAGASAGASMKVWAGSATWPVSVAANSFCADAGETRTTSAAKPANDDRMGEPPDGQADDHAVRLFL